MKLTFFFTKSASCICKALQQSDYVCHFMWNDGIIYIILYLTISYLLYTYIRVALFFMQSFEFSIHFNSNDNSRLLVMLEDCSLFNVSVFFFTTMTRGCFHFCTETGKRHFTLFHNCIISARKCALNTHFIIVTRRNDVVMVVASRRLPNDHIYTTIIVSPWFTLFTEITRFRLHRYTSLLSFHRIHVLEFTRMLQVALRHSQCNVETRSERIVIWTMSPSLFLFSSVRLLFPSSLL